LWKEKVRADQGMDPAHLLEIRYKEENYWWHVNERGLVRRLLRGSRPSPGFVLEVGCSGGKLAAELANDGQSVVATDRTLEAVRFAAGRGLSQALVFDAGEKWPFASSIFDVVIMLDVLERIERDKSCLVEAGKAFRGGGLLILTVPAHQFLFSNWDKVLEHKRRYSKKLLLRRLQGAGFAIIKVTYWNLISLLPAIFLRSVDRVLSREGYRAEFPDVLGIINALLKIWGHIENRCIESFGIPVGLSLVAVATKPHE